MGNTSELEGAQSDPAEPNSDAEGGAGPGSEPQEDADESTEPSSAGPPSPDLPEDGERTEDTLARALGGAQEAERQLFHKLWRFLLERTRRSPSWSALQGSMEVEDAAQGLWLTLFRRDSLAGFEDRGEGSLRAWLACCLERHLVDTLRRLTAEQRGGGAPLVSLEGADSSRPGPIPASPDPGASTIVRFTEWAQRCRQALTPREHRVWCLRVDDELDFEEIGERLGMTASAARGLHLRARERLQALELLGDEEPG